MPSRKKKHQRELKRKQKKQERDQRFRELHPLTDTEVVFAPPGVEKMSEVLQDFLAPYWDSADTPEKMHQLLSVAIIAWNSALMPAAERDKLIDKTLATADPEAREAVLPFLSELIRRKEQVFPDNNRFILSYDLSMGPSGPHLSVISSFTPP